MDGGAWSRKVGHDWATSLSLSLSCIGEGNGNPLQCSCLENPRDGGAWWAAVYGVAQSWTRLKWLSSSSKGLLGFLSSPFPNGSVLFCFSSTSVFCMYYLASYLPLYIGCLCLGWGEQMAHKLTFRSDVPNIISNIRDWEKEQTSHYTDIMNYEKNET